MSFRRTLLTAMGAAALMAPAATATTYDGSRLVAAPGERNDLSLTGGTLTSPINDVPYGSIIRQTLAPLTLIGDPPLCAARSRYRIECAYGGQLEAWLGDRADSASVLLLGADAYVHGGDGADDLYVSAAGPHVWGDDGNDDITIGDNGTGDAHGGRGDDELSFTGSGAIGLYGDENADRIEMTATNTSYGQIDGGAGPDLIRLSGPGTSFVQVLGGAGDDIITTRYGSSGSIDGGAGSDGIDARNGSAETITCGPGRDDTVAADPVDTVASDCEDVWVP